VSVFAGHEREAEGYADGVGGAGVLEVCAGGGEGVDVGGAVVRVAVTAQGTAAELVDEEDQNVWRGGHDVIFSKFVSTRFEFGTVRDAASVFGATLRERCAARVEAFPFTWQQGKIVAVT